MAWTSIWLQSLINKNIHKEEKKENYEIVLFNNSPIGKPEEDIFDSKIKATAVRDAINEGANTIALIGDYGSGKSSLTKILYDDNKSIFEKPIYINLWDCICKQETKIPAVDCETVDTNNNQSRINSFTKSFLYQFACGTRNKSFTKYINQRLSKNYGKISLSTSGWHGTKWLIGISLFLILVLYIGLNRLGIKIPLGDYEIPNEIFLFLAIPFIWITLVKDNFIFSLWDSQGKIEPSDTDTFEIFKEITTKLKSEKKYLIIVEDLDRSDDAKIVASLLKELYRFINLLTDEEKKKFIFIVSLKSEESLVSEREEDKNKEGKKEKAYKAGLSIYSKVFDYTVWIRPIHFENVRHIVKKLLEAQSFNKEKVLFILNQLYWIMQGENLSVREIKDRLNETFLLYSSLSKRDDSKKSVTYRKCAVVVYLQRQYPMIFQELTQEEKKFAGIIKNYFYGEKTEPNFSSFKFSNNEAFSSFQKDFKEMLDNKDLENDYLMYFYNYPSNAHINTFEEKTVYDAIIKNDISFINSDNCSEIIKTAVTERDGQVIKDACKELVEYEHIFGPVVLLSEEIFNIAFNKHKNHAMESIKQLIVNNIDNIDSICFSVLKICDYETVKEKNQYRDIIIALFCEIIIERFKVVKNSNFINNYRLAIHKYFSNEIGKFTHLYINSILPLASISVIQNCKNPRDIFNTLNFALLTSENYKDYFKYLEEVDFSLEEKQLLLECIKKIPNLSGFEKIGTNIKNLFTKQQIYDDFVFNIIYAKFQETDVKTIIDYVQSVDYQNAGLESLKKIDDLVTSLITDTKLIQLLEKNGLYKSAIYSRLKLDNFETFDFDNDWLSKNICDLANKINDRESDLFQNLRMVLITNGKINKVYTLFDEPFDFVKENELETLNPDDVYYAIDFTRIDSDKIKIIADYCNNKKYTSENLYNFFKAILFRDDKENRITDKSIMKQLFSLIDFNVCKFNSLNENQQEEIIKNISSILELDECENAIDFIKTVKCHIKSLTAKIHKLLEDDNSLFNRYIEVCNEITKPSDEVISFICEYEIDCGLSKEITDKLLKRKNYGNYIIGKSLKDNSYFFDNSISLVHYYNAYCRSDAYYELVKDTDLINKFYVNNLYDKRIFDIVNNEYELDKKRIQPFMKFSQTIKLFELILSKLDTNEERKDFIRHIPEFHSYNESELAIDIVLKEPYVQMFIDDENFINAFKEKLWEDDDNRKPKKGVLKSKFTKEYKKVLIKK